MGKKRKEFLNVTIGRQEYVAAMHEARRRAGMVHKIVPLYRSPEGAENGVRIRKFMPEPIVRNLAEQQ